MQGNGPTDPHSSRRGKAGRCANTPQQVSGSNHLQPQGQVSETEGSRRDEAMFQKLTQNNQQKILVSYIYSHNIYISLITNEVCIYLLAIWIFSPMICWFESCAHFSVSVCVCTDLELFFSTCTPLFGPVLKIPFSTLWLTFSFS